MMKCEYEKDFQTFAQHGCQNWRKSYIPKKKKKKKKKRIQIEHILQIIFVLIFSFLLI